MARKRTTNAKKVNKKPDSSRTYLEKLEGQLQDNQSKLSLILGALIVLVLGILIFNFFNRPKPDITTSEQSETQQQEDVSVENLPGKYTVKEDDTLFAIAEKYYQDGYRYVEIARANNLDNPNNVEVGRVLEIPKLENPSPSPEADKENPTITETPTPTPNPSPTTQNSELGDPTDTEWGPAITGTSYTVQEGDWLSKIATRAYGDMMAYERIAQANNIPNPDFIEPGMTLTIPR